LSKNKIKEVWNLQQKRVFKLNLNENEIASITLHNHPALELLELRKNGLIVQSINLYQLNHLTELYLAENQITTLDFFRDLSHVKKLHLRGNKIEFVGNPERSLAL
jgi:Leucine-rich repeat (LRR) protein